MKQGFLQRIFGARNISVFTGNSLPTIIKGIDKPNEFKEELFDTVSKTSTENAA